MEPCKRACKDRGLIFRFAVPPWMAGEPDWLNVPFRRAMTDPWFAMGINFLALGIALLIAGLVSIDRRRTMFRVALAGTTLCALAASLDGLLTLVFSLSAEAGRSAYADPDPLRRGAGASPPMHCPQRSAR